MFLRRLTTGRFQKEIHFLLIRLAKVHCKKMKFSNKDFFSKCVTFTKEILNGKLVFCAVVICMIFHKKGLNSHIQINNYVQCTTQVTSICPK